MIVEECAIWAEKGKEHRRLRFLFNDILYLIMVKGRRIVQLRRESSLINKRGWSSVRFGSLITNYLITLNGQCKDPFFSVPLLRPGIPRRKIRICGIMDDRSERNGRGNRRDDNGASNNSPNNRRWKSDFLRTYPKKEWCGINGQKFDWKEETENNGKYTYAVVLRTTTYLVSLHDRLALSNINGTDQH